MALPPAPGPQSWPQTRRPGARAACTLLLAALLAVSTAATPAAGAEHPSPLPPDPPAASRSAVTLLGLDRAPSSEVMQRAIQSFERLRDNRLIDPDLTLTALISGPTTALRPLSAQALPVDVSQNLGSAFSLALAQVQRRAECSSLFHALGADGPVLLATAVYLAPTGPNASRLCREGVAAYTLLGQPVTFLCPAFGFLERTEAATILIHEALHYGGLTEQPSDPAGLSPFAISRIVSGRCGF